MGFFSDRILRIVAGTVLRRYDVKI
jgi:hypothetical protein